MFQEFKQTLGGEVKTKTLRERWLEALRSGQFRQCFSYSRQRNAKGDSFCPWGVRIEIDNAWDAELTDECWEAVGLSYDDYSKIVLMNDFEHKSFTAIADWIEANT